MLNNAEQIFAEAGFSFKDSEQSQMFGGIRQVIFTADYVRDLHFQVVDDVDEVEDGLAI